MTSENVDNVEIVVVGDGGVGKSCLTLRFVCDEFREEYNPTLEEAFRTQTVIDKKACQIDIVDTAGQEEFQVLRDTHLTVGDGFLIVYSITNQNSFQFVSKLRGQIHRARSSEDVPFVLVGNKSDLEDSRDVSTEDGKQLAKDWGNVKFFETSAKTGKNTKEAFQECVKEIRKHRQPKNEKKDSTKTDNDINDSNCHSSCCSSSSSPSSHPTPPCPFYSIFRL
ncbi:ras-like protein [Anaeramoeba flamelloides]|uniref:small monomeric GTPase n=1 Tax=Anaeramoeba flamelloides TaxID=1746091 RepID=A0AAV7ZJZ1_9EUKA|nr:ras-like protein [Anaeramoeba flamelloides]